MDSVEKNRITFLILFIIGLVYCFASMYFQSVISALLSGIILLIGIWGLIENGDFGFFKKNGKARYFVQIVLSFLSQ